ncbi:MAG: fused response regulator/phosphatase [Alteromonadaceae bacterium]|nr:MAG: fused response regulator/phosphatase [Alteromonadaceae bacterium]
MRIDAEDPLKILIAEDSATDRLILESIVAQAGHVPIGVADGLEAIAAYKMTPPDIVLLDVMMPNMGGIEAAGQIRALNNNDFIPIIFLTSLNDPESLVKCLESGGDDFIPKPYNRVVLQSKIKAFGRMRSMHQTVLAQKEQIEANNLHLIQEQTVAKQVFDKIAHTGCLDRGNIRHYMSPLAVFNGDVLVSEVSPSGNMLVLLGDFTGHGLPAAIGSMPLATTFYGMVRKGFSMSDVLREINQKLHEILPVGFFCCAICVDFNFKESSVKIWNGGLPEAFLYRKSTEDYQLIGSGNLPLGVMPSKNFTGESVTLDLEYGDRLFMWSDGAFEARNKRGEMFGEKRLHQILYQNKDKDTLFDDILRRVQQHIGSGEKDDDISLVEIEMQDLDIKPSYDISSERRKGSLADWSMQFNLPESSLKGFDPLPLLMNVMSEVPGLKQHRTPLYTILAELYANALEHGVLGLSSSLKATSGGFTEFYTEKNERLKSLTEGTVGFTLEHFADDKGGLLKIRVKDSGPGFEFENKTIRPEGDEVRENEDYFGRGFTLMNSLCESLIVHPPGNDIEVAYRWSHDA